MVVEWRHFYGKIESILFGLRLVGLRNNAGS